MICCVVDIAEVVAGITALISNPQLLLKPELLTPIYNIAWHFVKFSENIYLQKWHTWQNEAHSATICDLSNRFL